MRYVQFLASVTFSNAYSKGPNFFEMENSFQKSR